MNLLDQFYDLLNTHLKPQGVKILSLVGFLYLTSKSLQLLRFLSQTWMPRGYNLIQRYGPNSWALITGGAQGIGAVFASELAKRGFNLILIDIDEPKLAERRRILTSEYPQVQVKTIVCDFNDSWKKGFYDSLMEQIQGLDISILVNNVGRILTFGPSQNVPEEEMLSTITINTVPMTILTRRLIPQMLERPTRSAIINMASLAGVDPVPWLATYSATKAYVNFFTSAIEKDVADKIDVLALRPASVSTAMVKFAKVGYNVASAEEVVQSGLSWLGKRPYSYGNWKYEISQWAGRFSPIKNMMVRDYYRNVLKISDYND